MGSAVEFLNSLLSSPVLSSSVAGLVIWKASRLVQKIEELEDPPSGEEHEALAKRVTLAESVISLISSRVGTLWSRAGISDPRFVAVAPPPPEIEPEADPWARQSSAPLPTARVHHGLSPLPPPAPATRLRTPAPGVSPPIPREDDESGE